MTASLTPVAIAHTPFRQKFAIPRQAGLLDVPAVIELLPPYNDPVAVSGLEQVSHIWLLFLFHQHLDRPAALQVRPPRLGGNKKLGVFASRSSFRPNHIGQSVVALERIEQQGQQLLLHVRGIDLLDGTPVLDIKPYLPYADSLPQASNGIAGTAPALDSLSVSWQTQAQRQLQQLAGDQAGRLQHWINGLIGLDPRPAYRHTEAQGDYTMQLSGLDIHWQVSDDKALVTAITRIEET